VLLAVWITLALAVVVFAGGTLHVVREGLRSWRAARRLMAVVGAGGEALAARADAGAQKLDAAGSGGARVGDAVARLQRSAAYARVVADAAGDVRATVTGLRGAVPRK
jgi:hypothetical protein